MREYAKKLANTVVAGLGKSLSRGFNEVSPRQGVAKLDTGDDFDAATLDSWIPAGVYPEPFGSELRAELRSRRAGMT